MSNTGTGKRVIPEVWEKVRADHEAGGMTFNQLQQKYGINRSTISRRAKQEEWNQQAVQGAIATVVQSVEEADKSIQAARTGLSDACNSQTVQHAATHQVQQLLTAKNLVLDGAVKGLKAVNDALDTAISTGQLETVLPATDIHSRVTQRYSKTLFGESKAEPEMIQKDDAVNKRRAILERIRARHLAKQEEGRHS